MSLNILPAQGSAASNLGAGLGQALSQQIPEEIMRYRTRSGLQNLGEQASKGGVDNMQLLSQLATIPGLDPGLLGVLAPLLQEKIQAREQQGGGGMTPQQGVAQGFTGATPPSTPGAVQDRAVGQQRQQGAIPARRENRQGYLIPPADAEIQTEARRLNATQPNTYRTVEAANTQEKANRTINDRYKQDVAYQERLDRGGKLFDKFYGEYLQKDKPFQEGEIGGKLRSTLQNKFLDELAFTDKSERQLAEKYAEQGRQVARDYRQMQNINANTPALTTPGQKEVSALRSLKKRFDRLQLPEDIFIDSLKATWKLSDAGASFVADPSTNSNAGKYIHSLKPGSVTDLFRNRASPSQIAKQLAETLTDGDNLQSFGFLLHDKGYQPGPILQELATLKKLTDDQERQVENMPSYYRPNMGDVWLLGRQGTRGALPK